MKICRHHYDSATNLTDSLPSNWIRKIQIYYTECDISVKPSLISLSYNFTISRQSNETQCLPISHHLPGNMEKCRVGSHDISSAEETVSGFKIYDAFISYMSSQLPTGGCYTCKYLKEVMCRLYFPQCDPIDNQLIHMCKETCFILVYSCFELWKPVLSSSQF